MKLKMLTFFNYIDKYIYLLFICLISANLNAEDNKNAKNEFVEPNAKEKLMIERINYLNSLRKFAGNLFWEDFGKNDFIGTIVYFTDSNAYFINPEPSVLEKVSKYKKLENEYDYSVLKLVTPYDQPTYIIETVFETEDGNRKNINYMLPILFCSSPEITAALQPEIIATQEWATSAFHELYHQYQFKETAIYNYLNSFIKQNRMFTKDSMQSIYENNWSYKDSLIKENDLLLKAINASSVAEEKKYFTEFLKTRNKRRTEFYKQKKITIGPIEEIWEKLEGTALYIDAVLKENFSNLIENKYLLENDKSFRKENIYQNYKLDTATDYTSINDAKHYFGATGINLVRLLEKNNVDYKTNFFKYASMPLSTQLKYFYKIK
jgi:hypothetical protein